MLRALALVTSLFAGIGAGGGVAEGSNIGAPVTLPTDSYRSHSGGLITRNVYDYAPSVMADGRYRMWWCSQLSGGAVAGDDILYAESTSLGGPFTAPGGGQQVRVFDGTATGWDQHTCDPSVLRVDGTYYMYYGGSRDGSPELTQIGVATSTNGLQWRRLNQGRPIITPAFEVDRPNKYGAGQPSTVYLGGKFYLLFTDTTGRGALSNGAGQFAWRSADPTFQSGVEVFTATGWQPKAAGNDRSFSVLNGFSVDWHYSDALQAFVVASNGPNATGTVLEFLDRNDLRVHPYPNGLLPGTYTEGPGLVSKPDKHARVTPQGECGRVPIDVLQSTANEPPHTLGHFGFDLLTGRTCADLTNSQVATLFNGYGIHAPGLPATFITGARRLQIQELGVYTALTGNRVNVSSQTFHQIPYGASLHARLPAVQATGKLPGYLLDDGNLWPVTDQRILTANGSPVTTISLQEYDSYPKGPALRHAWPSLPAAQPGVTGPSSSTGLVSHRSTRPFSSCSIRGRGIGVGAQIDLVRYGSTKKGTPRDAAMINE
ncbi:hypothetical protein HD597_000278 [Nonomuraea thailandensis]|uniref:Beta-xylosidase n=1 Tax=Nonomuraea thailandensis TaxID=1188745 RepID=A0A9X2JXZ6_9ACTN|nr:hypothetical protein [Nonomuraea thailandensis]MCP2353258.1 hypothetical protein [Nonomuraea thailandensis]